MRAPPTRISLVLALVSLVACGGPATPASPAAGSGAAQPVAGGGASTPVAPAAGSAGAPASPAAPSQPSTRLQVATQRLATDIGMYLAQDKGYFTEQGLDVEFVEITTGQGSIPPLAAGQFDVGVGAVGSGLYNALARGIDIKLVATKAATGPDPQSPFGGAQGLVLGADVAASGTIRDYRDLRGKTIGISDRGSGLEVMLDRGALQPAGLTADDVEFKTMAYPDMLAALANRSVDAGMQLEPFIAQGKARGILTLWKTGSELYPGQQAAAVVYGPTVPGIGANAGNRLMVAYTRGLRDYNDAMGPKRLNRDEIVATLIRNTPVKDAAVYDQVTWTYQNPDCYLNVDSMASDLDWYVANGYVPQKPDLLPAVDNSYCDYAIQQLGRYQP